MKFPYNRAYSFLEKFSFETFENIIFYSFKKGEEVRDEIISHFFSTYLTNSIYFKQISESPRRRELFNYLFRYETLNCSALYRRMAEETPLFLIETAKRHQVAFLHKDHFLQMIKVSETSELSEFFAKALFISVHEAGHYKECLDSLKEIKDKSNEEVFSLVGLWMYYYLWDTSVNKKQKDSNRLGETLAVAAMSVFVSQIIAKRENVQNQKEFDPIQYQREIIADNNVIEPPFYNVFLKFLNWKLFVVSVVDEFSFENSTIIKYQDNNRFTVEANKVVAEEFNFTNRKYYTYEKILDQDKEHSYENLGHTDNEEWFLDQISPYFSRDIRSIYNDFITDIYLQEHKISIIHLLAFLTSKTLLLKIWFMYITNEGLKSKQNWKFILSKIDSAKESFIKVQLPLSYSLKELTYINERKNNPDKSGLTKEVMEKCLDLCTLNIDSFVLGKFNRFKPEVNLFHQIWYKINGKLYCFPQITTVIRTHSFISNLALIVHKAPGKSQTEIVHNMEDHISELAKEKGLIAKSGIRYEYNLRNEIFKGEVDAVFFDGKKLLAVEFKRSALRGSFSDINYEKEVVLEFAARQLKRFKKYVDRKPLELNKKLNTKEKVDFSLFPFEGLIVTTNFEHDHKIIQDKFVKISWVEWLWILKDLKEGDSIDSILSRIQKNTYWEEVVGI